MKINEEQVVVEEIFNASINRVWKSITVNDEMIQWYFENIPSFEAEVGFETQFNVENEGRVFPHLWKVTEVEPNKKITYTWKFDGYPGDSFVEFELFEQGSKTRLKVSVTVLEDFSDDIPEFRRESCVGGWEYFIKGRLKEYLENK